MKFTLALFLGLYAAVTFSSAADKPNIVLILSDDQTWTDYGFMGHKLIKTPNLDKLSKRSAVFPRGYVPVALCRPSLSSLITGLYPHQHGVTGNDPALLPGMNSKKRGSPAYTQLRADLITNIDRHPTLPKLLAKNGYSSHQSGKWWEGSYKRGGFTDGMTRGFPEPGGRHGDDGLKIGRAGMKPVFDFIDKSVADDKPFYVYYAPFLPHTPHNPPERLFNKYKDKVASEHVAKYYAMCEWFDETCGQLLDHLDAKGVTDNTIIYYVCDNGWIQKEDSRGYAPRSKQSANEGGTRQPTMISWPGKIKPKIYEDTLVTSLDYLPTMLAAAGAESDIPKGLPGLNLLPLIVDGKKLDRDAIYGESFAHDIADLKNPEASLLYRWVIQGNWKLLLTYDGKIGRYKSSHPRTEKRPQLYNLKKDPTEEYNLAKDNPDLVAKLAARIDANWPLKQAKAIMKWTD